MKDIVRNFQYLSLRIARITMYMQKHRQNKMAFVRIKMEITLRIKYFISSNNGHEMIQV